MLIAAKDEILSVVIPQETFFSSGANLIKNANFFLSTVHRWNCFLDNNFLDLIDFGKNPWRLIFL